MTGRTQGGADGFPSRIMFLKKMGNFYDEPEQSILPVSMKEEDGYEITQVSRPTESTRAFFRVVAGDMKMRHFGKVETMGEHVALYPDRRTKTCAPNVCSRGR